MDERKKKFQSQAGEFYITDKKGKRIETETSKKENSSVDYILETTT